MAGPGISAVTSEGTILVLRAEGRVTLIDGVLALAVLIGLTLDAFIGWWWADPVAGYILVYCTSCEARHLLKPALERP